MGRIGNIVKGIIYMGVYIVTTMVIPFLTFTWVRELSILGVEIVLTQHDYENIIFWIVRYIMKIFVYVYQIRWQYA